MRYILVVAMLSFALSIGAVGGDFGLVPDAEAQNKTQQNKKYKNNYRDQNFKKLQQRKYQQQRKAAQEKKYQQQRQINQYKKKPYLTNKLIPSSERNLQVIQQMKKHDRARDAMKSGRIVSLSVIRSTIKQRYPGRIVDVQLIEPRNNSGQIFYNVKVLTGQGKLMNVRLNARNGNITNVKGQR